MVWDAVNLLAHAIICTLQNMGRTGRSGDIMGVVWDAVSLPPTHCKIWECLGTIVSNSQPLTRAGEGLVIRNTVELFY